MQKNCDDKLLDKNNVKITDCLKMNVVCRHNNHYLL